MLYRVIKQNIVEEHHGPHPSEFPGDMYWCWPTGPTGPTGAGMPKPTGPLKAPTAAMPAYNTDAAIAFRFESRRVWSDLLSHTRNYLTATFDNPEEMPTVKDRLMVSAEVVGNTLKPYYGLLTAQRCSDLLKSLMKTEMDTIEAIKNRVEIAPLKGLFATQTVELANFLSTINPQDWPVDAVILFFENLRGHWEQQAYSRQQRAWMADQQHADEANWLMVTGTPGTASQPEPFAEVFAKGVINQFPERFRD